MTVDSIKKTHPPAKGPPTGGAPHPPVDHHAPSAPAPKGPPGKEVHLNKPVQKSHGIDDEPEAEPPPKPDGSWSVRMSKGKAIALIAGLLLCMGAAAVGSLRYEHTQAAAAFRAKLAQAVIRQADLHRADGQSYQEVALVDSVRRCVAATLEAPDWVIHAGLAEAPVEAIATAAETRCLDVTLTDAAKAFVIAREAARIAPEDAAKDTEANRRNDYIRFVVTFAKMKGYAIPTEFKGFATDITILDRFGGSEGAKPAERPPSPLWTR